MSSTSFKERHYFANFRLHCRHHSAPCAFVLFTMHIHRISFRFAHSLFARPFASSSSASGLFRLTITNLVLQSSPFVFVKIAKKISYTK